MYQGQATAPASIDLLLAEFRNQLDRVDPENLQAELADGALLIDTRPVEQRERDGSLPGAFVIDRNVLEWRLDPTSRHRIREATAYDRRIIVVCNEGFSSTLAAMSLRSIGLYRATDLVGGFQALAQLQAGSSRGGNAANRAREGAARSLV
jgi:rhodanese-related sulfurtransferase